MGKTAHLDSVQLPSLHPIRIVNESMTVHLYSAVAVVSGVCRETGVKKGKRYSLRLRFIDTWVRRSESRMCVASQSTLIDP
jgi:hypothetical protein